MVDSIGGDVSEQRLELPGPLATQAQHAMTLRPAAYVFCLLLLTAQLFVLWQYSRPHWTVRLDDLQRLQSALESFRRDAGAYPVAQYRSLGQPGVHPDDWIPGLVPRYLTHLPRDPRLSGRSNLQYIYTSDGNDYKIIVHGPEDFGIVSKLHPEMIDPRRSTFSYAVWTQGAAQW